MKWFASIYINNFCSAVTKPVSEVSEDSSSSDDESEAEVEEMESVDEEQVMRKKVKGNLSNMSSSKADNHQAKQCDLKQNTKAKLFFLPSFLFRTGSRAEEAQREDKKGLKRKRLQQSSTTKSSKKKKKGT